MLSLHLIDLAYICIYIYHSLNILSGDKSCLVGPRVAVPPWATETVLSPLDSGWWGQGIARTFTRCMMKNLNTTTLWKARWLFGRTKWLSRKLEWRPGKTGTQQIWIRQLKENALRVSVAGRENISPTLLTLTVTNWIWTRLQRVIAAGNLTASEGYESTRHAGANNIILQQENVNRMIGLWIRNTPTVFKGPLLSDSVLETFLTSQEFSGPRVIRKLLGHTSTRSFLFCSPPILRAPLITNCHLSAELYMTFVLSDLVQ